MGPTPIDDRGEERVDPSRVRDGQGVRRRLWGAVSRLAARLFKTVGGVVASRGKRTQVSAGEAEGANGNRAREAVAIRPSGQARLESGPTDPGSDRSSDSEREPQVAARVRGGRLRVYHPENEDAYITSDVYERVKR